MELLPHLQHFVATYGYFAVFLIVAMESAGHSDARRDRAGHRRGLRRPGNAEYLRGDRCGGGGRDPRRQCGYWVGREFGFPLVYRYGRYIRLDERRLKVGQYLFLRHGGKIVFFGRFVAVLRAFAAFLAGVNRYNWAAFFLFNAAGGIVWATIFGVGGYLLGRAFEHYARPVGIAVLIAP